MTLALILISLIFSAIVWFAWQLTHPLPDLWDDDTQLGEQPVNYLPDAAGERGFLNHRELSK